jgi:hypothetical protein
VRGERECEQLQAVIEGNSKPQDKGKEFEISRISAEQQLRTGELRLNYGNYSIWTTGRRANSRIRFKIEICF